MTRLAADLVQRMRHRRPEDLVAHRIQRDQRVAHAGLAVGPPLDPRRRPLTLQLGDIRAGSMLSSDLTGEIPTALPERVNTLRRRLVQQRAAVWRRTPPPSPD